MVHFMLLQNSVTLIDTLSFSYKLHFHLKNLVRSQMHRRLSSHYGTEELQAMRKMLCFTPLHRHCHLSPPLYALLINEKLRHHSKNIN